jgi:hypothetical protein
VLTNNDHNIQKTIIQTASKKMTIITNFDLILIANQQHEQQNYPHLADAEQVQFEFLGMELLVEDDSTVNSYSDDSTIESSEGENDLSLIGDDEWWMPLARPGPRREARRPSPRSRSLSQRLRLERKEEELEEGSVVLVGRNRVRQSADDFQEEDSLRLSKVPRRKARSKRQPNNEDDQCDNDTANDCEKNIPFLAV